MTSEEIVSLVEQDSEMMQILRVVEVLKLNDWMIGAGFVRSKVWDYLHNYDQKTALPDIDVIYFNSKDFKSSEAKSESTLRENELENTLTSILPEYKWSVTNQARMHWFHDHPPYVSSTDALSYWVETATCVAVTLQNNRVTLIAPHGIDDLVNLVVRPSPGSKQEEFAKRYQEKNWLKIWPKLTIKNI